MVSIWSTELKRIAALKPLSIDHHHGLALARKARSAANSDPNDIAQQKIWSELEVHAKTVLYTHFKIEETCLANELSALNDPNVTVLLQRMHDEHAALRKLLSPGSPRTAAHLMQIAELLTQHIRFEERELFEIAQTRLDPQALDTIANSCNNN